MSRSPVTGLSQQILSRLYKEVSRWACLCPSVVGVPFCRGAFCAGVTPGDGLATVWCTVS